MSRLTCISILEAGSFTTDSGNVLVSTGDDPFEIEVLIYALIFVVKRNSFNICVVS